MFERFTDRARQTVHGARKASEELGHNHIGTEHLLLAMVEADGGIAHDVLIAAGLRSAQIKTDISRYLGQDAEALESIGIDLDAVRAKVEETFGPGALDELQPKPKRGWFRRKPGGGPFTPRAKKTLELSLREALALKDNYIGTEHILLGLLREGNGVAARILADAGLDFGQLRTQTLAARH